MKINQFDHEMELTLQNAESESKVKGLFATMLPTLRSKINSIHNVLCIL